MLRVAKGTLPNRRHPQTQRPVYLQGRTADAVSGATPKSGQQSYIWDCTDESGQTVVMGEYHFIVEGIIFWKDAVLYNGVINVNSEENTAIAAATYTTDESKQSDMITDVKAVYRP